MQRPVGPAVQLFADISSEVKRFSATSPNAALRPFKKTNGLFHTCYNKTMHFFLPFLFACVLSIVIVKLLLHFSHRLTYEFSFMHDPVYVPTRPDVVEKMLKMAHVKKGTHFADLGSGDGRVVIEAAKRGAIADGYEVDPFLILESRRNIQNSGHAHAAHIIWQSFWKADFSQYDVIFLYATAIIMDRMEEKLRSELKPGAVVIMHHFHFPHWKPIKQDGEIFLYRR